MSRLRLGECEIKFHAERSEAEIFFKKYKISALKFIVLLLNCTLGPPNLEVGGGPGPPPGSASDFILLASS